MRITSLIALAGVASASLVEDAFEKDKAWENHYKCRRLTNQKDIDSCKRTLMLKIKKIQAKFYAKDCGRKIAKICKSDKNCWRRMGRFVKECYIRGKLELAELKAYKPCPVMDAVMKKCAFADNKAKCI